MVAQARVCSWLEGRFDPIVKLVSAPWTRPSSEILVPETPISAAWQDNPRMPNLSHGIDDDWRLASRQHTTTWILCSKLASLHYLIAELGYQDTALTLPSSPDHVSLVPLILASPGPQPTALLQQYS